MASCQKVPKFDFQRQFSVSKIIEIFLIFFSLKITNLGAHLLLLTNLITWIIWNFKSDAQFLTARHFSNYQNLVISFDNSCFLAKILF